MTLGDDEAKRRGVQKSILERQVGGCWQLGCWVAGSWVLAGAGLLCRWQLMPYLSLVGGGCQLRARVPHESKKETKEKLTRPFAGLVPGAWCLAAEPAHL